MVISILSIEDILTEIDILTAKRMEDRCATATATATVNVTAIVIVTVTKIETATETTSALAHSAHDLYRKLPIDCSCIVRMISRLS